MYEQFKVDRGRKDHWAMYPCPAKIPVVYEPLDRRPTARPRRRQKPTASQVLQTILDPPAGPDAALAAGGSASAQRPGGDRIAVLISAARTRCRAGTYRMMAPSCLGLCGSIPTRPSTARDVVTTGPTTTSTT